MSNNTTLTTRLGSGEMVFMATALPVVVLVGLVGNAASFAVLVTVQMRRTSVYFYLTVLSISDSIVLVSSAFKTWLRIISGFELLHQSSVSCKGIFFILNLSYHVSAWVVVLVTVDRFVAVWLPLKSALVCTVTRSKIATCILVFIASIYNSPIIFIYDLHLINNTTRCCIQPTLKEASTSILYLKLLTYCVIPFVAIVFFNVLIYIKLRRTPAILIKQTFVSRTNNDLFSRAPASNNHHPNPPSNSHPTNNHKNNNKELNNKNHCTNKLIPLNNHPHNDYPHSDHPHSDHPHNDHPHSDHTHSDHTHNNNIPNDTTTHTFHASSRGLMARLKSVPLRLAPKMPSFKHHVRLTPTLFAICISWILLTLPYCLFSFIVTSLSPDPATRAMQLRMKALCFFLFYTNHSINFFLYCLVGKRFRTRLKALLCSRRSLGATKSLKTHKSLEMKKVNKSLSQVREREEEL